MIFRVKLMKCWRRGIGHNFQANVENACNQAFGFQAAAEPLPDELLQSELIADAQQLVRFGLGELLVNGYDHGHREVVRRLIVANQYLHDGTNGYTAEFHRSTRV